ncbi:toxin-antitoxin system TumE family protein [Archaeoglobus veneficus]|uniref:Uncharacterized protein n=1 Tax=Archaeoglobus veneficus (strain DSM 11195 / SNP6) TaxID=693661 RepID=F2KQ93_ARCVS|nr:DUF6516 family protein [Archaeoglobus veneficus]AEA46526.1 hypothetical protein Arcve_0499 [Archaeoglobus veneficus SNP6]
MIEDYFEFLKKLALTSSVTKEIRVLREFCGTESGFIRFVVEFIDNSELHVFEHVDRNLRKTDYSYHWQDKDRKLLLRWDNAPHHPEIETFPHHLHRGNKVEPAEELTFAEALKKIESKILKA